jgi:hypothetical protein
MSQLRPGFVFAFVCMAVAAGMTLSNTHAKDEARESPMADKKREELWKALTKALPTKYNEIDAYAENPSLTEVLFYSQGAVLKFSLEGAKLEEIQMMKRLGRINSITFEKRDNGGNWILWLNGQREAVIDAGQPR